MAFVSLIFMYFVIIVVIACVSTLIGIILFIVSAVMKKKQLNKKKEAWLAGNNNYQMKKTYIIPRVFGFISMIPLVICIISILYISISPPADKQTSSDYIEENGDTSGQAAKNESPETVAKEQAALLIESIENRDTDSIINMFCEYRKKSGELSGEIEKFLEFIDGDIVSYDEPYGFEAGWSSREMEGVVESKLEGRIENIKTSTGKTYRVRFYSYDIYKYNPEYVGVYQIVIHDEDYEVDDKEGYIYIGYSKMGE